MLRIETRSIEAALPLYHAEPAVLDTSAPLDGG